MRQARFYTRPPHLEFEASTTWPHVSKKWSVTSDFVTNSYSESWDTSCEKSWVPVLNHWVPVEKEKSQNERALIFIKPDSYSKDRLPTSLLQFTKILMKNIVLFLLLNNSQNDGHRNHKNRIFFKKIISSDQLLINLCILRIVDSVKDLNTKVERVKQLKDTPVNSE